MDRVCQTQLKNKNKKQQKISLFDLFRILVPVATERERQLMTARANQTTGLTNGREANWAPEVKFSSFRALSRRQMTFSSCC